MILRALSALLRPALGLGFRLLAALAIAGAFLLAPRAESAPKARAAQDEGVKPKPSC